LLTRPDATKASVVYTNTSRGSSGPYGVDMPRPAKAPVVQICSDAAHARDLLTHPFAAQAAVAQKSPEATRDPVYKQTAQAPALQRQSHLYIHFLGIARPQPNIHIHVSVSNLYIPRQTDRGSI
jgi:hypothetical protein